MRVLVVLALVACASALPPAKRVATRPASSGRITYAETPKYRLDLAPPPPIDLAVVIPGYDESRPWPLSELPSVQPHWDPAMAHDACSDEWKQRHVHDAEALAYVAAWCRLRAQDRGAIDELGRLARTARAELAKPARLDVVNLAADNMDAQRAMAWLDSHSLGSIDNLDLLLGTYVALGMRDEARTVVVRLAKLDPKPQPAVACERLIETAHVGDAGLGRALGRAVDAGECGKVAWRASCALWRGGPFDGNHPADITLCERLHLDDVQYKVGFLHSYFLFDVDPKTAAFEAVEFLRIPGAEELAVSALEIWSRAVDCDRDPDIAVIATRLRAADSHSSAFDARLAALHGKPAHCM